MTEPSELRIASWNVYVFNEKIDEAVAFIEKLDADVLCMQEVSETLLKRLESLPYHMLSAIDRTWQLDAWRPSRGEATMYVVILSKHPILSHEKYLHPPLPSTTPWQTHLYYFARYIVGMWRGGPGRDSEFLKAEIQLGEDTVEVWSAHLSLFTPAIRSREFATLASHLNPDKKTIVCGDFNILDSWRVKLINWLQGGRIWDALPWSNERTHIQESFSSADLTNPLAGTVTHPIAHSQLDHILVSNDLATRDAHVIRELHGSDHYPVELTISL